MSYPHLLPRPAQHDNEGNEFVTVVDITGIHHLPTVKCICGNQPPDENQFMQLALFPTSFALIRTVFTFRTLSDYRLSNLECKTSAYQYYAKLRRLTCPAFPKAVVDRYKELRRLSRQFRNMKLQAMHGRAYCLLDPVNIPEQTAPNDDPELPNVEAHVITADDDDSDRESMVASPGGADPDIATVRKATPSLFGDILALFCPTCPQPGINLPENWQEDKEFLFIRKFCADGNFKADHLNQRNAADDVSLSDGDAFMTASQPYQEHLKDAKQYANKFKEPPTCHSHRAQLDSEKVVSGRRVRGIGVQACARHGCFCPGSLVDFEVGERQMCMDYSVSEALKHTNMGGIKTVMLMYDIMCQYYKNMRKRFAKMKGVTWPARLRCIRAVGLWHVHGHKSECLYRWASTYIPGVGMVDGEILETLWSLLNRTSKSMQTATTAHRAEVLDDHMGDSNWKKAINMHKLALTALFSDI